MPDGKAPKTDRAPASPPLPAQPCLGQIVALDTDGRPRVSFPGAPERAPVARLIGEVPPEQLEAAIRDRRPVLIAFLDGRAETPVIMSLSSMQDLPGSVPPAEPAPETEREFVPAERLSIEVDGQARDVIEAEHELVLRCGDAAIVLKADGSVRITGRDITSWARRRQRIRGGSVAIN